MPMNLIHRRLCRSAWWAGQVESAIMPWALEDVELGPRVLEIGPGYGVTTELLIPMTEHLTALEVDQSTVDYLRAGFGDRAEIVHGDGASIPLPDNGFSAAVCFAMLHHVPSPQQQDQLFAEACRVLEPGGVFAGSDSMPSLRFALIHLTGTRVDVDPATLPDRLRAAGFTGIEVHTGKRHFRFRAYKPR